LRNTDYLKYFSGSIWVLFLQGGIFMKVDGMDALVTRVLDNGHDNSPGSTEITQLKRENAEQGISEQSVNNDKGENSDFEKAVTDAVDKVNKALLNSNRELKISIHEKTRDIMVKILDSETKEVIREIPPEKVLDMVAKLCEIAGILVDERR